MTKDETIKNLETVLAQKDNEIYELRQRMAGLEYKIEQLDEALEQGRIRDQSIVDEAVKAARSKDGEIIRVQDAEIMRLRKVIEDYERERISRLGGIGSPA